MSAAASLSMRRAISSSRQLFGAQAELRIVRRVPLVLQTDGDGERQAEVARDAPGLRRGVAFAAVEAERQTQDHPFYVKAATQLRHVADELFPVGASERGERADGQAQLVGDGDADAHGAEVEGEHAPFGVVRRPRLRSLRPLAVDSALTFLRRPRTCDTVGVEYNPSAETRANRRACRRFARCGIIRGGEVAWRRARRAPAGCNVRFGFSIPLEVIDVFPR